MAEIKIGDIVKLSSPPYNNNHQMIGDVVGVVLDDIKEEVEMLYGECTPAHYRYLVSWRGPYRIMENTYSQEQLTVVEHSLI